MGMVWEMGTVRVKGCLGILILTFLGFFVGARGFGVFCGLVGNWRFRGFEGFGGLVFCLLIITSSSCIFGVCGTCSQQS